MLNTKTNESPVKCYRVTLGDIVFNIMSQDLIVVGASGYAKDWIGKHFFDAYLHYTSCNADIKYVNQCSADFFYQRDTT